VESALVAAGQSVEAARRWAEMILECSPMSVRASKQAVYQGLEEAGVRAAFLNAIDAANKRSEELARGGDDDEEA